MFLNFSAVVRLLWLALLLAWTAAGATEAQRVQLADASLAETAQGRMNLKYLASCALDEGVVLTAQAQGQTWSFPGAMALAPQWAKRALTPSEERWVSACLLARTNFFGVPVQISTRTSAPSPVLALQTIPEEEAQYPLEEATFFGNFFTPVKEAYVCANHYRDMEHLSRITAHKRICSLPVTGDASTGRSFTPCGFIHVGLCTPEAFVQNGVHYQETITIYLPAFPNAGPAAK